ncbi:MAG: BCCT family transporter [Deltaproteobacteria bacterium]|nr:BCCT family transporter [Deltaproteobacteria bacterium]
MPDSAQPARRSRWRANLFRITLPICVVVAVVGIVRPDALADTAGAITSAAFQALDWFFMALVSAFLVFCLWLAFGRHGGVKLGADDEKPEFSTVSWIAMLFAAGMGVGLLFWGVAEPVTHFSGALGTEAGTPRAARHATVITAFHWGLHAWAVYCVAGLVLAYFGFRRGVPYLPGAPLRDAFGKRPWVAPVAALADGVAVLAIAFGVAGSMGMGIFQLHTGLHVLWGVPLESTLVSGIILVVLVIAYTASASTSLDKGIQWLSNINMALALLLMLFVLGAGPTAHLLRGFVTAVGDYSAALVGLSLRLYPYNEARGWLETWTLTYFLWWIAWAPFVGVFIARISRGRTIKEFVLGVLFVPTAFSLLWFSIFGGTGLDEEMNGAGGIARLVREDVSVALFSLFDRLPLSGLLSVTALLLVFIFLVTSVDSATFVLGMLTSRGSLNPPTRRKLAWGLILGALGGALMLSGSIDVVRAVAVLGAIPFAFIMLLQVAALLRVFADERKRPPDRAQATAVEDGPASAAEEAKTP